MLKILGWTIISLTFILFGYIAIEVIREIIVAFNPKLKDHKLNKAWMDFNISAGKLHETLSNTNIITFLRTVILYIMITLLCWSIFVFTFPFILLYQMFQFLCFCLGKKYKKEDVAFIFYFNFFKKFYNGEYL